MRPELWQRVIRKCPAAGILLAGLGAVLSAATISGTVVARDGDRFEPVFRAEVIAREGGSAEIAAVARTDREGRYLISGLSAPRVALSVQKSRYFTAKANGREGDSVTLDCSVPADCSDVRFEMGLGGVVSGMVRDEFGEPVMMAMVTASSPDQVQQQGAFGGAPQMRPGHTTTDERGYFRLFGLRPGPYIINSEVPTRGPMTGRGFKGEPVNIEVEEGRELHGILIGGRRPENSRSFTVSGKLSGVELSGSSGFITVLSLSTESRFGGFSTGSSVQPEGSFTLPSLAAGRYALSYVGGANRPMWGGNGVPLGIIDVQSDLTGLVLKPLPPTGFSGVLQFESGSKPEEIQIRAWMDESWTPFNATAKAPDYRFEMTNLHPGTYRLEIGERNRGIVRGRESGELFLRGIRRGTEITPARDIVLAEGRVEEMDLVISNEFSRVHGQVKAAVADGATAPIRKGAQFQVGISGPSGFRAMQADQNGRFDFDRVVPGEYRICAWSAPDAQAVYDEKTWESAGGAVRKFSVEAGSEVEIDLTAVP
ncbi:MAG: carboxypeptidase regulatory-like domain-containing protein [Bryobacterales bacterium]